MPQTLHAAEVQAQPAPHPSIRCRQAQYRTRYTIACFEPVAAPASSSKTRVIAGFEGSPWQDESRWAFEPCKNTFPYPPRDRAQPTLHPLSREGCRNPPGGELQALSLTVRDPQLQHFSYTSLYIHHPNLVREPSTPRP